MGMKLALIEPGDTPVNWHAVVQTVIWAAVVLVIGLFSVMPLSEAMTPTRMPATPCAVR